MTTPAYTFGSFQLNQNSGGLGYFLTAKELPLPIVKPITFPIARFSGLKKSGEQVDARTITVTVKVVGTSRSDLINRLDTLQQALSLRAQTLIIHEDGRSYQSVDAMSAPVSLTSGKGIVQCECAIAFIAYDPSAYASSGSTYDTGTVVLTSANAYWNFPLITLTGGGTTYSYPFIRLYNKTSTGSTTLSAGLTSGNAYTSISVNATPFSGMSGDTITITHSATTQTLTVSSGFSAGATTINVTSFTASASYVPTDVAAKVTQWTNFSITQMNDNQTISAVTSVAVPLPSLNNDYVDIQCNPTTTNGWTIQTNNSGKLSDPIGLFPVIEPGATVFTLAIASASAVSAEAVFSWTARYAS